MKTRMISRIALVAIMTLSAGAASQRQAHADDAAQIIGAVGHTGSKDDRQTPESRRDQRPAASCLS